MGKNNQAASNDRAMKKNSPEEMNTRAMMLSSFSSVDLERYSPSQGPQNDDGLNELKELDIFTRDYSPQDGESPQNTYYQVNPHSLIELTPKEKILNAPPGTPSQSQELSQMIMFSRPRSPSHLSLNSDVRIITLQLPARLTLITPSSCLKNAVALPSECNASNDKKHWIARHTEDFFELASLITTSLEGLPKSATDSSQQMTYANLLKILAIKINDNTIFPRRTGSYSETFGSTIQTIFEELFQLFSRLYSADYENAQKLGFSPHLNTIFLHFMYFSATFDLLTIVEIDLEEGILKIACPKRSRDSQHRHMSERKAPPSIITFLDELPTFLTTPSIAKIPSTPHNKTASQPTQIPIALPVTQQSVTNYYKHVQNADPLFRAQHYQFPQPKFALEHFKMVKAIGEGGFGRVSLCHYKEKVYAIKAMAKANIVIKNHTQRVWNERDAMISSGKSDWFVPLHVSFQDKDYIYYIMDYCPGGDMLNMLINKSTFSLPTAQFYTAELVLAVHQLHKLGFAHRDLKPDNILFDRQGHLILTDFGFVKKFPQTPQHSLSQQTQGFVSREHTQPMPQSNLTLRHPEHTEIATVVGTPAFIAPEVLRNTPSGKAVDWWAVGNILYEMIFGYPPFQADNNDELLKKIIEWPKHRQFPKIKINKPEEKTLLAQAVSLLKGLICEPDERLNFEGIKQHPFFSGINWETIRNSTAPFKEEFSGLQGDTDTSQFDLNSISTAPKPMPKLQTNLKFFGCDYSCFSSPASSPRPPAQDPMAP